MTLLKNAIEEAKMRVGIATEVENDVVKPQIKVSESTHNGKESDSEKQQIVNRRLFISPTTDLIYLKGKIMSRLSKSGSVEVMVYYPNLFITVLDWAENLRYDLRNSNKDIRVETHLLKYKNKAGRLVKRIIARFVMIENEEKNIEEVKSI